MKRSRFSEEQIIGMLKEHEGGVSTADEVAAMREGAVFVDVTVVLDLRVHVLGARRGGAEARAEPLGPRMPLLPFGGARQVESLLSRQVVELDAFLAGPGVGAAADDDHAPLGGSYNWVRDARQLLIANCPVRL